MRKYLLIAAGVVGVTAAAYAAMVVARYDPEKDAAIVKACAEMLESGLPLIAGERADRFQGKVDEAHARCRGGEIAVARMPTPWVDWANYWAAGNADSKADRRDTGSHLLNRNTRGIDGALLDLEYQRMELIKFNVRDNSTFEQYLTGRVDGKVVDGPTLKTWKQMRLPPDHQSFRDMRVEAGGAQLCGGQLIRFRTLSGICNDIRNPAMGSTGMLFARNVEFESTYPDLEQDPYARNRHAGRLALLVPDPQVISRKLFTRDQSATPGCNEGRGTPNADGDCAYKKAPFFNVLAAFWIQFMTHDWFSHLDGARNDQSRIMTSLGCSAEAAARLGCRPDDKMDAALIADAAPPARFAYQGTERIERSYKTARNHVTAWWDTSQIYGYDEPSRRRMRRDPKDPAKLAMEPVRPGATAGERYGYLPLFRPPCGDATPAAECDPIQPEWVGQEAAAFPDNWSIGLSFFHNLFAREHNIIIDALREKARTAPDADSGLRDPDKPSDVITYGRISNDELFEIARLIVAAEIAKIHTIEWTTQLLYDEPLDIAMNSNWSGLFKDHPLAARITRSIVKRLSESQRATEADQFYSALAAGSGIVGTGNSNHFPKFLPDWLSWDRWSVSNPDDVNGGVNHFGSPFNFSEEFVSVYRLHPLVPDLLELRDLGSDPNSVRRRVPVVATFRAKATAAMRDAGLPSWALTMGRQRLGLLALRNHPQFLQNLDLRPRIDSKIDVGALDIIRDREHGIPRFNEFRRQIGLRQLTGFDDFIDRRLPADATKLAEQQSLVDAMREIYGQHRCDASKIITTAQRDPTGAPINDCLSHPDGSMVDNIEDLDLVVGFLAETTRPHGFAISETQFQIFILNASRRLFSDRFFTSSFRPEFYTQLGIDWVTTNGPTGTQWEDGEPNGHKQEILPLKRVLLRAMPELAPELAHVVNSFDPWARDRGQYYSVEWKARADAGGDRAFDKPE